MIISIGSNFEGVELAGARPAAAFHVRARGEGKTFCGRSAKGARVLSKLSGVEFEANDPDCRICRRCLRLRQYHRDAVHWIS